MTGTLILDPLLPLPILGLLTALAAIGVALALWRRLSGWWLRGLAGLTLLAALANPSLQQEAREPLSDIVILVVDRSASQGVADRPRQIAAALANVEDQIARRDNTELRIVELGDGEGDAEEAGGEGTQKMAKKGEELKEEMDELLDEIDNVLEENAEEFVKNYVQRGGE